MKLDIIHGYESVVFCFRCMTAKGEGLDDGTTSVTTDSASAIAEASEDPGDDEDDSEDDEDMLKRASA